MRYKLLGDTGLRVSELSLGTMTFGEDWGWGAGTSACRKMLDIYTEAGGNVIDTAVNYTDGKSEEIVGELIEGDRDRYVLATKYTLARRQGDPNAAGNQRKNLFSSVETSLERLRTDHIDLLWVHAWDPLTPLEETMRALDDLVRMGKVHHVGFSDAPAWVVARAHTLAEERGLTPFAAIQVKYNLLERTVERELLPMARELGLGVTTWSPLEGGILAGKYLEPGEDRGRVDTVGWEIEEHEQRVAQEVVDIAEELDVSPAQVAIAWIRHQDASLIPIVGATKPAQLEDNLASLELTLGADHLERLDALTAIERGFPMDFLDEESIEGIRYAGLRDRIDA